ncbi:large conductance mechanosensitive channel [Stackebrandtia endophytica]|uniref:Large-conductance mechanosensitive channel n=1 Tax=Stackebrandtia endophytica TaxID=1496996 RepID=A0A543B1R0_9ACTN|nr:large conductance mechanosensitive channel protein MscL [Stackebrandtia endophytica]TQL78746.1 large conductance mechanosensitive channel [Stackebrandtia endophytica]
MFKGFRDFVMRGNVVELAVAVVMGAAMSALVGSFTSAFIEPLIKLVTGGGQVGGEFVINDVVFEYSLFINGLITFLLTAAAVYFVIVLPMNKLSERLGLTKEEEEVAEEITLLREIRDELRRNATQP